MFGRRARPEDDPDGYVRSFYEQLQPEPGWVDKAGRLSSFLSGAEAEARAAALAAAAMGMSVDYGSLLVESNGSGFGGGGVGGSPPTTTAGLPRTASVGSGLRRPRVAVVTSGSVAVPLDSDSVNALETVGSGNRGAACAEAFLKAGYWVVFLYRDDSLRPFSRVLNKRVKKAGTPWLEQLRVNPATGHVELALEAAEEEQLRAAMADHAALKGRLLELPFVSLYEYLYLLREACLAVQPFGAHACLFLAAGLTKKYVPRNELRLPNASPLDDGTPGNTLKLAPVPFVLRQARREWCPLAFLVAFKLENDAVTLSDKAHDQLERHGLHMVVGNAVRTRGRHVLLVTEREEVNLVSSRERELEPATVRAVVRSHKQYRLEREALRASRRLLGLSAKFCMFREGVSIVDEDALGNKNVPFVPGIRIKGNRRAADSPIYELVKVYHNKSRSARCHLWKRVGGGGAGLGGGPEEEEVVEGAGVGKGKEGGRGEVLVTFSPAGNPETILHIWGDTWKGWLEEELKSLFEAAKHVPLATYLRILTAPLTADFTDAALLLERCARSLSQAWQQREKTQFIQAMANLLAIGFDRGLAPMEGLRDARELLALRELVEAQEGGLRSSLNLSLSLSASDRHVASAANPEGQGQQQDEGGGRRRPPSLKEVKLPKAVFRGRSDGMRALAKGYGVEEEEEDEDEDGDGGKGEEEEDGDLADLVGAASKVRLHHTVQQYAREMLDEGVLEDVMGFVRADPRCRVIVTGYSLGGMLSQIFMLSLGEALLKERIPTRNVRMLAFGSPRVGDEGLKARLRLLYPIQSRLLNIVYPLDTTHAFPPSSEGYADAVVKVFLKQPGQFVGRRKAARTTYTNPLTWLRVFDSKVDEMRAAAAARRQRKAAEKEKEKEKEKEEQGKGKDKEGRVGGAASPGVDGGGGGGGDGGSSTSKRGGEEEEEEEPLLGGEGACKLCGSEAHTTGRHRCHICTERGSHRAAVCPNKGRGCALCGAEEHSTGEHLCSVCGLRGHRGRNCHDLRSVGWAELSSYAIFHDYYYYSLATQQEEAGADFQPRLASAATITPPVSPVGDGGDGSGGSTTPPRIVSGSGGAEEKSQPDGSGAGTAADGGDDEEAATAHRLFGVFGGMKLDAADVEAIEDVNHL